jgi:DNA invertase Pin-like site-specific DNA recombinase
MNPTKAVLYIRVSTFDQNSDTQLRELEKYCEWRQWEIVEVFRDDGVSGTKKTRPALEAMMKEIRAGKYDVLLVWSYDRFARSLSHLATTLDYLRSINVDFASYRERADTTTTEGKLMFGFFAVMAEFERNRIADRTRATLARLKAQGKRLGRPPQRNQVTIDDVLRFKSEGFSMREIGKRVNMSKTWVHGVLKGAA